MKNKPKDYAGAVALVTLLEEELAGMKAIYQFAAQEIARRRRGPELAPWPREADRQARQLATDIQRKYRALVRAREALEAFALRALRERQALARRSRLEGYDPFTRLAQYAADRRQARQRK